MYRKYLLKTKDGRNNLCGTKIREYRLSQPERMSQRMLADELQRHGFEMDKWVIRDIENGKRCVTDIELKLIADALKVPVENLLS